MARRHTVTVDAQGSVSVEHHNGAEALAALADVGGSAALNSTVGEMNTNAQAFPHTPMQFTEPEVSEFDKALHKACSAKHLAHAQEQRQHAAHLETATRIAQSMIQHGKTRRRDPEYIADKAQAIANALHDRYPNANTMVSWDDIESAVRAEMGQQSA